ncbi:MAG: hypothetical protein HRF49_05980 [bacterium]|jgi:hypothetical protein
MPRFFPNTSGAAWQKELIDDEMYLGSAIALDAADVPHALLYDPAFMRLMYLKHR